VNVNTKPSHVERISLRLYSLLVLWALRTPTPITTKVQH